MVVGCVLISCEPSGYRRVIAAVKRLALVRSAFPTTGRWDVVVEIQAPNLAALGSVAQKVRSAPGVKASETLVAF